MNFNMLFMYRNPKSCLYQEDIRANTFYNKSDVFFYLILSFASNPKKIKVYDAKC